MADLRFSSNDEALDEIREGFDVEGAYGYTADHAPYVNWETTYAGTQPPFKPIRKWVHRKWNDLDAGMKAAAVSDPAAVTTEEWKDAVAWLVVKAIAANGTVAIRFMERSMERARGGLDAVETPYRDSEDPHAPFKIVRDFLDLGFGISQDIVADEATDTGGLLQSGYVDVQELNGDGSFQREGN